MIKLKKAEASFTYSLHIVCPHCSDGQDLIAEDDESYTQALFGNDWDSLKDTIVQCKHCEEEFLIDFVIY